MEAAAARSQLPLNAAGQVDYSGDFFGEKVFLTVSGQLNGEAGGSSICNSSIRLHTVACTQQLGQAQPSSRVTWVQWRALAAAINRL